MLTSGGGAFHIRTSAVEPAGGLRRPLDHQVPPHLVEVVAESVREALSRWS